MDNILKKEELRSHFRDIRLRQTPLLEERIQEEVLITLQKILNKNNKENNNHIGIYWPLQGEIDLRFLKTTIKNPIALPATYSNSELRYHKWTIKPLIKDAQKIPSPLKEPPLESKSMELLLIPALAIDTLGTRLGYGGGFFDRLRANSTWRSILALAILPQACVSISPLPKDKWDIPLDGFITEKGPTYFKKVNYSII